MKVLLIDDSMTMRRIQKRVLTGMGYEDIVEAGNGKEGLMRLVENNFQMGLILCDINMPEMSGIETLMRIRANPKTKSIPVIMCTSVAEKQQVMEALKAGANSYIVKPFEPASLKEKIEAVITG